MLAGKVQEAKHNGDARLPLLIRQKLTSYGVDIFNPRGRDFATIPEVMQCLGIMIECIDPSRIIQDSITSIKQETINTLNGWRDAATQFALSNPAPNLPNKNSLQEFINDWQNRNAPNMNNWPSEWPLLELLFTVTSWFPLFQKSPEGQIYIETIARTIAEASQVSNYRSSILTGTSYDRQSVKDAIREVFEPIAEGDVDVDEEIMPYIPRSVFPIMTIHQAKGLEFPLVIVDIGSDFKTNHHAQRPFRYPKDSLNVHLTEDEIANFSPVGQARVQRTGLNRSFDDLTRQYFVAKSRPQNILLLVGLTSQIRATNPIPSVATGDLRNGGRTYQFMLAEQWTPNSSANTIALI
jgi:DNA helicase II / ATP-dependent DNA helicase PcrA